LLSRVRRYYKLKEKEKKKKNNIQNKRKEKEKENNNNLAVVASHDMIFLFAGCKRYLPFPENIVALLLFAKK